VYHCDLTGKVLVSQNCFDEVVPGLYTETCHTSSSDEKQATDIKVEDVSIIQEKEDSMPATFPVIKDQHVVSCVSLCTS
jgi:hypothetical protein